VRLTVAPLVLATVVGLLTWHDRSGTSAPTDAVLLLLAAGAAFEVAVMLGRAGKDPARAVAVLFSAALAGLGLLAPSDPAVRAAARSILLAGAVLATFAGHIRAARPGDADRILSTLFPVVYVGYLFGLLREVGDGPLGARNVALVVVASKASDIGGWVVGKAIGRHRMIPSVSPGKTWEGTAGGLLFSVGAALLVLRVTGPLPGLAATSGEAAALGLLLGAASIVAGLTQSALKRRCGVKDSSALLPEMGGILDMIDSILLAAPAAWLWALLR
jgi:phosphatidate cytidylyltransferase